MCGAGGWCLNRALSYLCCSVEQGEKNSSVRGAPDFSKYCLFISRQRWKRLHIFPSPYFIIHQYFHVSPSPQIVWDQTVASPPAVGVSTSPYFEDLRLVQIGTFGGLRTASHTSLTTLMSVVIVIYSGRIPQLYSLHSYSIIRYCTTQPSCLSIIAVGR